MPCAKRRSMSWHQWKPLTQKVLNISMRQWKLRKLYRYMLCTIVSQAITHRVQVQQWCNNFRQASLHHSVLILGEGRCDQKRDALQRPRAEVMSGEQISSGAFWHLCVNNMTSVGAHTKSVGRTCSIYDLTFP